MNLVKRITTSSNRDTPYGKAVAIQSWFTAPGRFKYTLNVPSTQSSAALIQFLTKNKEGYCQQFAFGMAVLARLAGIPARVVVGYTQGSFIGNDNWQVKTSDAHAWPELFFPGDGWLRFEPTPPNAAGPAGQATAEAPAYSIPLAEQSSASPTRRPASGGQPQRAEPRAPTSKSSSESGLNKLKKTAPGGVGGASGAHQDGGTSPLLRVVIALLAVMLIAPATPRASARRWRWWRAHDDVATAHVAWHELRSDLTDHRIGYRASESPRALTRRIATSLRLGGAERGRAGAHRPGRGTGQLRGQRPADARLGSRRTRPWCGTPSRAPVRDVGALAGGHRAAVGADSGPGRLPARARRVRLDGTCDHQGRAPLRTGGVPGRRADVRRRLGDERTRSASPGSAPGIPINPASPFLRHGAFSC